MTEGSDSGGVEDVRDTVDGHPMVSLFGYVRRYWPRLSVGVFAALLTRLSRLVPPVVVGVAIDRVITAPGNPGLLAKVGLLPATPIPEGATAARVAMLEHLVAIAALAYLVRSLTRFASRYLLQSTAQRVQHDLRTDTYDHMQRFSMSFFADHQTGGMMSILNNDVNRLETFLNTEIRQIIRVVAIVGGISVVLFYYSPVLALIALAPVPLIGVASGKFLTWIEPKYADIRETVARLNSRLENNLGGVNVVKAFNRHGFEHDRVAGQSEAYQESKVEAIRLRRGFFSGLRLLTGAVFVTALYVGGMNVIGGASLVGASLTAGTFATFFLLLRRLYSPMRRIGKTANKYQRAKASAERVFGVLGREPDITSPANPVVPDDIEGDVTFDDVTFGYDEDHDRVIEGISLDVDAGDTIGLAGPTGAGKSTLLDLVPRFYDVDGGSRRRDGAVVADGGAPEGGAVRVDGVDVRDYDLTALREEIGIVEQDPYLFSGTVRENIAYGDADALDATVNGEVDDALDTRIREAAEAAEAHEFITDLPDGYETTVGERGVKLSGGQRQRVAIARALLNDPSIILLDEATSDVDTETEELIQASLQRLCEDRTAFVIAHRLSTIRDADEIVVLEDGTIDERGTHEELVATGGTYADLWESQADDDGSVERAAVGDD